MARTSQQLLMADGADHWARLGAALGRRQYKGIGWSSLAAAVVAVLLLSVLAMAQHRTRHVAAALAPREVPVSVTIDKVAARAAIEKANAAWLAAYRSGDFGRMASIYSEDASLATSEDEPLEGRGSIIGYFNTRRERGLGEPFLRTVDVVTMGDVAYETGTYGFTSDARSGLLSGETGRYFVIWKAGSDGIWRYNLGIWTSNAVVRSHR